MSVPTEVEASASGSAWVSYLSLCHGALEFAGALSSGSGCESGLPRRTHDVALHNHGFIVLRIPLFSDVGEVSRASFANCFSQRSRFLPLLRWSRASPVCDCTYASSFALCTQIVSFRPGFGSLLRTHTPHHPWAAWSSGSLPKVLPRSCSRRAALHLKCRLRQLHSPVAARMDLPRRNAKAHRVH